MSFLVSENRKSFQKMQKVAMKLKNLVTENRMVLQKRRAFQKMKKQGKLYSRLREVIGDTILRVAPPERAPRRHVERRSVMAALLHHSPSYDLPCT